MAFADASNPISDCYLQIGGVRDQADRVPTKLDFEEYAKTFKKSSGLPKVDKKPQTCRSQLVPKRDGFGRGNFRASHQRDGDYTATWNRFPAKPGANSHGGGAYADRMLRMKPFVQRE